MVSTDKRITLQKIKEIKEAVSQGSISQKGKENQEELISSLEGLSRLILNAHQNDLSPSIIKNLIIVFSSLSIFLKDVNTKHDKDYEDWMDSLPEGDDD